MKKDALQSLRTKSVGELETELRAKREELRTLRFELAAGKVKNVAAIRAARKHIARILTVVDEK